MVTCSICLEPILADADDDDKRLTLPCAHQLHQGCWDKWAVQRRTCPVCRTPVTTLRQMLDTHFTQASFTEAGNALTRAGSSFIPTVNRERLRTATDRLMQRESSTQMAEARIASFRRDSERQRAAAAAREGLRPRPAHRSPSPERHARANQPLDIFMQSTANAVANVEWPVIGTDVQLYQAAAAAAPIWHSSPVVNDQDLIDWFKAMLRRRVPCFAEGGTFSFSVFHGPMRATEIDRLAVNARGQGREPHDIQDDDMLVNVLDNVTWNNSTVVAACAFTEHDAFATRRGEAVRHEPNSVEFVMFAQPDLSTVPCTRFQEQLAHQIVTNNVYVLPPDADDARYPPGTVRGYLPCKYTFLLRPNGAVTCLDMRDRMGEIQATAIAEAFRRRFGEYMERHMAIPQLVVLRNPDDPVALAAYATLTMHANDVRNHMEGACSNVKQMALRVRGQPFSGLIRGRPGMMDRVRNHGGVL